MTFLLFSVALALSAVAAYYSIMGLVAIFSAAVMPIIIMGSILEVAKLVVASWIYRNWKEVPFLMKSYFMAALLILMLLTSMGIFGFLSKAHMDQSIPTGDVQAKLALIDEKIKQEKEIINEARKTISQLDRQVDETLNRTATQDNNAGVNRSITIRRQQQGERNSLLKSIGTSQEKIAKLNEERAPIASEVRKVEAEVGPIKYIAALIYGDDPDQNLLESAVRWVIIMIVFVFDPLAVLMLVAANWQIKTSNTKETEASPDSNNSINTLNIADSVNTSDTIEKEFKSNTEEMLNIEIEEPTKDWEPELFQRKEVKKDYDHHASYPEKPKTQSFLNKVSEVFRSPDVKTIEKEVEDLQDKNR